MIETIMVSLALGITVHSAYRTYQAERTMTAYIQHLGEITMVELKAQRALIKDLELDVNRLLAERDG